MISLHPSARQQLPLFIKTSSLTKKVTLTVILHKKHCLYQHIVLQPNVKNAGLHHSKPIFLLIYLNNVVIFTIFFYVTEYKFDLSISGQIKCLSSTDESLQGCFDIWDLKNLRMRSIRLWKQTGPRTFFCVYFTQERRGGIVNSNQTDADSSFSDMYGDFPQCKTQNKRCLQLEEFSWCCVVLWRCSPTHRPKIFEKKIRKLLEI